jgi:hypothetical protein
LVGGVLGVGFFLVMRVWLLLLWCCSVGQVIRGLQSFCATLSSLVLV